MNNQPENTPQYSPEITPTANGEGGKLTIMLGLVLLLVVSGGIYYLMTRNSSEIADQTADSQQATNPQNEIEITPTDSPASTATPSSEDDATADWKTYSSTVLSFKYPKNLSLEERQTNYLVLLLDANNPQSVFVSIDARETNSYANYENAVLSTKSGLTEVETEEITNGVMISGKLGPGYREGQPVTIALIKHGSAAIAVETTSVNKNQLVIFNQILSTFTIQN